LKRSGGTGASWKLSPAHFHLREELVKIEALHACLIREKEILHAGSPEALLESNREKEQILSDLERHGRCAPPVLMNCPIFPGSRPTNLGQVLPPGLGTGPAELMTLRQGLSLLAARFGRSTSETAASLKTRANTSGAGYVSHERAPALPATQNPGSSPRQN
jgi:hypothetical protein